MSCGSNSVPYREFPSLISSIDTPLTPRFLRASRGFFLSAIFGVLIFFTYLKFPIDKVFKTTEYIIILLGASMMGNGIIKLFDIKNGVNLIKLIVMTIYILIIFMIFFRRKRLYLSK